MDVEKIDFKVRQAKQQYGWMHEEMMHDIEALHKHLDETKVGFVQNLDPEFFRGWNTTNKPPTKEMVEAMQALKVEFDRTAAQLEALRKTAITTYRTVKSTEQYDICIHELNQPEPSYRVILNLASSWFEGDRLPVNHPNYQKFLAITRQFVKSNPAEVRKWLDDGRCEVIEYLFT